MTPVEKDDDTGGSNGLLRPCHRLGVIIDGTTNVPYPALVWWYKCILPSAGRGTALLLPALPARSPARSLTMLLHLITSFFYLINSI